MVLLKRMIQGVIGLILAANLLYYWFRPDLDVLRRGLFARSRQCSISHTVWAAFDYGREADILKSLQDRSRILETDAEGFRLWETPKGRFWMSPRNANSSLLRDLAEQARKIYGTGEWGVHPGDIVLDCGANVGVFTREALAAGAKLVVAVEPSPENVACLRRNFSADIAAGRVLVYDKGVWDKDDFLVLYLNSASSDADGFVLEWPEERQGPTVPLTTIDKLVAELKLPKVDFIKMDIEGAEQRALAGAQHTLEKYKPRLAICVYHLPDDREKIPQLVRKAWSGYRAECGPCAGFRVNNYPGVLYFR